MLHQIPEIIPKALDQTVALLRHYLPDFTEHFRDSNSCDNFYPPVQNTEWTTGFCTGTYWLAYEHSKETAFRDAALIQVDSFLERIEKKVDVDHHDMGFLYTPSCTAAWLLEQSESGKRAALLAADHLCGRFQENGQFLQAWGALGAGDNYRLIIDCLLNLPLLYWASSISGNLRYRDIALSHTKTSLAHLIRPDNSTYHTYFFDPATGKPTRGVTHQGYRDGSAWARGQAWGIYGTALAYRYTKEPVCLELFKKVTDYYLDHLPQDLVPYWDLQFTAEDNQPRDSSSAAIAACGILEMCAQLPPKESVRYHDAAVKTIVSLAESYAVTDIAASNGLLLHGVYAKSSPYNPVQDRGVDECNTWGDYFYMEALTRLTSKWNCYW